MFVYSSSKEYYCSMETFNAKKYNTFEEFNKDSHKLIKQILNDTVGMIDSEKVSYAREVFDKTILNSYIVIGQIPEDIKQLLNSKEYKLKFSMDNMLKNRLIHPEVCDEDYKKIPLIINNPSKYYKTKSGYDVILFKADTYFYKLVIKTTKNRKENFVKSLHLLNEERYYKY